ncbi:MAG: TetR/AcrR family bet gene transcriptional repressor [Cryomorphaceae bacterium]|jgi:TetR/AcrR family transcriptional repressor of bet genes
MPKVGMQAIRRSQLINATFECIHRYGFAGTTIAKVSAIAGVSTGIVSHYFGDKNGLLEATMRRLLNDLGHNAIHCDQPGTTPPARIASIINGNFAAEQITPYAVTTWLAFWAQALHVPALRRLQKINMRRLQSNLRYWLKQLMPKEEAYQVADGLAALIDGLWLRGAFSSGGINTQEARQLCFDYFELQLASNSN